jgi:hypothetical protein
MDFKALSKLEVDAIRSALDAKKRRLRSFSHGCKKATDTLTLLDHSFGPFVSGLQREMVEESFTFLELLWLPLSLRGPS